MTRGAWVMMAATWSVVVYFTARFFWKVLTSPARPDDGSEESSSRG